jgi:hypothetical protein
MTINLAPVIQTLVGLAATAIGILGSAVLYKLTQKFNLQISASQQAAFDSALNKSLTYGATQVTGMIAAKGWDSPTVHDAVIASAMTQAANTFPAALAGVGLTPNLNDPRNAATLTAALQRALPQALAVASASPATPPTTAPNPETRADAPAQPTATLIIPSA